MAWISYIAEHLKPISQTMKPLSTILCHLFGHTWQLETNSPKKISPYNMVRKCKICHRKEALVNLAEYTWENYSELPGDELKEKIPA